MRSMQSGQILPSPATMTEPTSSAPLRQKEHDNFERPPVVVRERASCGGDGDPEGAFATVGLTISRQVVHMPAQATRCSGGPTISQPASGPNISDRCGSGGRPQNAQRGSGPGAVTVPSLPSIPTCVTH